MRGVLLVPSSSPTLSPIYDGLGVNVTSNIMWFHLNHDMVSRRIYKLSFYGRHSINYKSTGWFTLKTPNLFPGKSPRRFFDSYREMSSICPYEEPTRCFFSFSFLNFRQLRFFPKCGPPYFPKYFRRKQNNPPPEDQTSGWACKTRVQNFMVYLSKTAWTLDKNGVDVGRKRRGRWTCA